MTKMIENKMLLETAAEPKEQDPDEAYDAARAALSDEAYADLHITLVDITRLQSVSAEIERLTRSLRDSLLGRRQAE